MNLSDRVYLGLHIALTGLVCLRFQSLEHWSWYVAWNLCAIAAILLVARFQYVNPAWEFVHGWLPALFFLTMFEETSFLALSIRGAWQNQYVTRLESLWFPVPPALWMHQRAAPWLREFLEFGYLTFYLMYPVVGGLLWLGRSHPPYRNAFRRLTDALSIGYLLCYVTYLLFPVQSPANILGVQQLSGTQSGAFQAIVHLIQSHGGVHGNAFPSAHIMVAFVVLCFVFRLWPRAAPWLLCLVMLMCVGAVYDGYHYATDIVAGALLGLAIGFAMAPEAHRLIRRHAEGL